MSSKNEHAGISSILIATDGSTHAKAAVEYGAWLAAKTRASVTTMHVIDARRLAGHFVRHFSEIIGSTPTPGILERLKEYYHSYGRAVLESAAVICESYKVWCAQELETGNVVKILAERSKSADLLIMGQHGEDEELETGFLGSIAEKVIHKVERPVLLAQPPFRKFRRALLAYDGSAAARRAMESLARLAAALNIEEVDAVELVEPSEPLAALREVPRYFKQFPVHVSTRYLTGDSLSLILDYVRDRNCDLMAMGAYADQTAEKLGLGSTTEYLMRESTVPVLVHH